jgi:hypothetical protein
MTCTDASRDYALYKQRLQRTEKKHSKAERRLAISLNDLLRRADNRQLTEAATQLLKTAQRCRAVQTDRALMDDVIDLFF